MTGSHLTCRTRFRSPALRVCYTGEFQNRSAGHAPPPARLCRLLVVMVFPVPVRRTGVSRLGERSLGNNVCLQPREPAPDASPSHTGKR
jgi:hypothetical protein